ncbi:MAG TPA: RNA polymerase sigma factor [Planctomycetes bacterium]|nr:RNA polymerase sigma factor [Planctomycetota bacterium]
MLETVHPERRKGPMNQQNSAVPPASQQSSEAIMARLLKDGSEADFEAIYRRHAREALDFAYRMLRDVSAAEDAVQEAFTKLYKYRYSYAADKPFKPWFYAIVRSCINDTARSAAKMQTLPPEAFAQLSDAGQPNGGASDDPSGLLIYQEEKAGVFDMLLVLDDESREIVVMHIFQNMTFPEIAQAVDSTADACRMRFSRAMVKLKNLLQTRGEKK